MFISPKNPQFGGYHEFSGKRQNVSSVLDTLNPRIARSEWASRMRREMTDIMYNAEQEKGIAVDHSVAPVIFKFDGTHIIGITGQDVAEFNNYKNEYNKDRTQPAMLGDVFESFKREKKLENQATFQHNVDDHVVYLNQRESQALSNGGRPSEEDSLKLPERQSTW